MAIKLPLILAKLKPKNKKVIYYGVGAVFVVLLAILAIINNKPKDTAEIPAPPPITVSLQSAADSRSAQAEVEFPGLIASESEAKVVAKISGNAVGTDKIKVGSHVTAGQILFVLDDLTGRDYGAGFNAAMVKQAALAVNQAQTNYELARVSYNNAVESSAKDLKTAELGRDQALSGKSNQNLTATETLKSAELALETARIAAELAKNNLEIKSKQISQSAGDTEINSSVSADAAVSSAGSIIAGINSISGLDSNNAVDIPYKNQLGVAESTSWSSAKDAYDRAKLFFNDYSKNKNQSAQTKLDQAVKVVEATKDLAEKFKHLLDVSVATGQLSTAGLSGLQASAGGYLTQINGSLTQLNLAKQGLGNLGPNNQSALDGLQKAYALAKNQEAQAAQAVNSLKAGNQSQSDLASFASSSAENNYQSLKAKINTQLYASKSQLDLAATTYQNAQVALQSLYDSHQIVSPINGFLTKKSVSEGDAVSPGQLLLTVSQTDNVKAVTFVDADIAALLTLGQAAEIKTGDKNHAGIVSAISPAADPLTRRFLVEVKPTNVKAGDLVLGTVATVSLPVTRSTLAENEFILPLKAISIGQNGNYIFIADNNRARQISVEVGEVSGETAKVKGLLKPEDRIIIDGARLLSDGQEILEIEN